MQPDRQPERTFADWVRAAVFDRRPALLSAPSTGALLPLDFARSAAAGLEQRPRTLECRFLYDSAGSRLYEEITRQPEYYPTRTESAILESFSDDIARMTGPVTLVELGSGSSTKTGHLLSAYRSQSRSLTYLPVDVSRSALQEAAHDLGCRFPEVTTVGIHGTYEAVFPLFRTISPIMVVFLGSTIGNFDPAEADAFLQSLAGHLGRGDFFLLGIDLVKEPSILEAAYNDAAGVTAAFTRNLFVRMNRELGSAVDVGGVEHVARWNGRNEQIEIDARFSRAQSIRIAPLGLRFDLEAGATIRTEVSRKFRLEKLLPEIESAGFRVRHAFTDSKDWFALVLLEKVRNAKEAIG